MKNKTTINSPQIFFVMFLSRIFVTMTYIPALTANLTGTDIILQIFIGITFVFITSIPIFIIIGKNTDANFIERCMCISTPFGRICAVLYAIAALYSSYLTVQRFNIFATSLLFSETNFTGFLIIIILASTIAAILGLEAMGRSVILIFTLVIVSLILIFASVSSKFDWLNFAPPFYDGLKPVLEAAIVTTARTTESVMLLVLMPKLKGNLKKGYAWWLIGLAVAMATIYTFSTGVLGEYAKTQMFPLYSLTVVVELNFIQRVDVFLTSTWVLCIYVKMGIGLYLAQECLNCCTLKKHNKLFIIIFAVLISILTLIVKPNVSNLDNILNKTSAIFSYIILIIIIPTALLICEKVKEKKENEN